MAVDTKARSKAFLKNITIPPIDIRTSPREMLDRRTKGSESLGLGQQIIPVDSTLRSVATEGLGNLLGGGRERYQSAQNVMSVLDALPYAGGMLMTDDINTEYQEGNYKTAAALGAIGLLPFGKQIADVGRGAVDSAGNYINQVAQNMPTFIDGFYTGKPLRSFARDASRELGGAVTSRTSAVARAFEEVWGISSRKMEDIMNRGGPAERLRAKGEPEKAVGLGEDAEKTALAIEAQINANIIPVNERGALAQGYYGLSFYDRAIEPTDVARISNGIGNGFRTVADIPDNITDKFTNHLINGPHVKAGDGRLYEYQIKSLESSRGAGVVEGAGYGGKGSPLSRAFNVGKETGETTSPFAEYEKILSNLNKTKKGTGVTPISAINTVEYTQLATILDKDATSVINKLIDSRKKDLDTRQLLKTISRARAYERAGKKLTSLQRTVLDAFNEGIGTGGIKSRVLKDEAGIVISNLDYNKIKKPEGYIAAQQSYSSMAKELGGVNHMVIVDPYNRVNYSMTSDGHDIFGQNPIGGHPLITAQPIVKKGWGDKGYNSSTHTTMYTRENVAAAVQKTEQLTGLTAPENVRNATGKTYAQAARKWTNQAMQKDVTPNASNILAANRTQNKVTGAKAAGSVAAGAGLLTGYNAAQADTPSKVWQAPTPASVFETRTDTKSQASPVVAKPTPPQKKTQQVFGQGDTKTIQREGKSVANVSRQQLQETGLSLKDYLNTWNKTGNRP